MQAGDPEDKADADLTEIVGIGGRCSYVLLALLLMILVYPNLIGQNWGREVLAVLFAAIVVSVVYALGGSHRRLIVAAIFGTVLVVFQWIYFQTGNRLIFAIDIAAFIVFTTFALVQLFVYLMRQGAITADKLHAALAIYLLSGFFWAGLYLLLFDIDPASFSFKTPDDLPLDYFGMLYFSFTTLTSVGYGDIVPVSPRAQSLVILEQVAGVFYVAVLIARLAGVYPPRQPSGKE
jgi:hypothetical protein